MILYQLDASCEKFERISHQLTSRTIGKWPLLTTKTEWALKKPDLQQLFTLNGLKGLCAPGPEGEPVRLPIEQNIWRWAWLGVAILVFTIAIVLAKSVR
jgi:hypothetical protein